MAEATSDSGVESNLSSGDPITHSSVSLDVLPSDTKISDNLETSDILDAQSLISDTSSLPLDSSCSKDSKVDELPGIKSDKLTDLKIGFSTVQVPEPESSQRTLDNVAPPEEVFFTPKERINMIAEPESSDLNENFETIEFLNLEDEPRIKTDVPSGVTLTVAKKNVQKIKCLKCRSTILVPEMATLVEYDYALPTMEREKSVPKDSFKMESFRHYWCVDNMFSFENVGFSHTTHGVKYLICADCEIGPIGWHDVETKLSYVSPFRIRYV